MKQTEMEKKQRIKSQNHMYLVHQRDHQSKIQATHPEKKQRKER